MTPADRIVALVAHARDVPARERQRFRDALRAENPVGGVVLETCHRVELYAAVNDDDPAAASRAALPTGGQALRGEAAVRQAVAVAVGRDSVVVGEDQVLHQLRRALDDARASDTLDPVLERLFGSALRAGRRARSWHRGPIRSLADVAIGRIQDRFGSLSGRPILIVGAGSMGRLASRAAVKAGATVAVTSRSVDHAHELAAAIGAGVEEFDPDGRAGTFAGIVVALAGAWPIGSRGIDALGRSQSVVVDLSVPPAIPDRLGEVLGRRLTTADDLAHVDHGDEAVSERVVARLDELIERTTAEFLEWLDGHEHRAAASALVERADREREAELAELWRRLPDLDPEARATIEGMSRHLAERLLREPLERLGSDADGRHERAIRELWAL
jgi:glutamyl-tRNA reductase